MKLRPQLLRHAASAALVWVVVTLVGSLPAWRPVELTVLDILNLMFPLDVRDTPIVIVALDEPSFADLGHAWPWPRAVHADLVDALRKAGADAIAFDIIFSEPSRTADDEALAAAIARSRPVVLAASRALVRQAHTSVAIDVLPLPELTRAGAVAGDVRLPLDADGFARRVPEAESAFWRAALRLLATPAPPASGRDRLIRYAGPPRTFPTVAYYQALAPASLLPPDAFRGKLVLVGLSLDASPALDAAGADAVATPFLRTGGAMLPGVEAHATIIEAARQNRLVVEASPAVRIALLAAGAVLMLAAALHLRATRAAAVAGLLTLALAGGAAAAYALADLWLPVAAAFAGVWTAFFAHLSIAFAEEQTQRRFVRRAFGMYVSDEIIEHMLAKPDRLVLGGERRVVTFVFTDVGGFTTMTEKLDPQATVAVLRDYFEGMTRIVFRHGGTLGQLLGDGMLLFFNAPVEQPDHAQRAVACALDFDRFACDYAHARRAEGVPIGFTRIGVNTGPVIVGNFGSSRRFLYTGVGDAINTAARLESANKFFGTRICVSAATAEACSGIAFRPIGEVQLKGKAAPTALFEPLPVERAERSRLRDYQAAYALIAAGRESEARTALDALARADTSDGLVSMHRDRLDRGERGVVIVLTSK